MGRGCGLFPVLSDDRVKWDWNLVHCEIGFLDP